ncbi:MAG TPA: hypothetical protein VFM18_10795, partial [Methanosarcina sp.]|nr:hypothetical protein [Methanosarcina sp.]
MSEVVLNFKPENQKPPRKGAYYVAGIKLNPGRNKIPVEQFDKIKTVPNYQGLIDGKIIEVFKGKPPDEDKGTQEIKSLSGFPVREAEKLINGEKD